MPYAAVAFSTDPYYFGIRRVPYSTDMTKDPLTFKHIEVPIVFGGPINPNAGTGPHPKMRIGIAVVLFLVDDDRESSTSPRPWAGASDCARSIRATSCTRPTATGWP